ncbi:MAG: hypothetical protein KAJ01_07230, partial [Candidatus Hydrogenedentes bacterium]|nr:hypothetical protein [Candidatus Hydrogenedentota bacterium]
MQTLGQQKIDPLWGAMVICVAAIAVGIGLLEPMLLPWAVGLTAILAVLVFWSVKWDITLWAWLWVLSYGLLDWPEWKIELIGFFNLTVPRLIFLGSLVGFFIHFLVHRRRLRFDRLLLWAMLALVVYVTFSAHVAGWTAETQEIRSAPYYRFIGSILFPFVMFFLLYNAASNEKQIRRALILITIFGWYALYIGYLQYAAIQGVGWARDFIWPGYINDPDYGIHFDRARGPFAGATAQAVFMVLLFYVDLYLIRKVRGPYRAALVLQAALVPLAIFFTLLRSAYLSFLICGVIWILWAN